jgi:hypothetical protein
MLGRKYWVESLLSELQPKNDWAKFRHDFQFLAYCVEYKSFFKQKMYDRFRLLAMKLPLQNWSCRAGWLRTCVTAIRHRVPMPG